MFLFINIISLNYKFIIFNKSKIIDIYNVKFNGQEFEKLYFYIEKFLKKNKLEISLINWITIINWPWWFTSTRILTLTINTIFFVNNIKIDSINYFEFLELQNVNYPILIKANKQEYLIKQKRNSKPYLINIWEIKPWKYIWIWNNFDFANSNISIQLEEDYNLFFKNYKFNWKYKYTEPYYIKRPSITIKK